MPYILDVKRVQKADTLDDARRKVINGLSKKGVEWYNGVVSRTSKPKSDKDIVGIVIMRHGKDGRIFEWMYGKNKTSSSKISSDGRLKR